MLRLGWKWLYWSMEGEFSRLLQGVRSYEWLVTGDTPPTSATRRRGARLVGGSHASQSVTRVRNVRTCQCQAISVYYVCLYTSSHYFTTFVSFLSLVILSNSKQIYIHLLYTSWPTRRCLGPRIILNTPKVSIKFRHFHPGYVTAVPWRGGWPCGCEGLRGNGKVRLVPEFLKVDILIPIVLYSRIKKYRPTNLKTN